MDPLSRNNEEKRAHKRFPVSFPVLYTVKIPFIVRFRIGNRDCVGTAQDIGEGGIAVLTHFEIPADSLLSLRFAIVNEAALSAEDHKYRFELDGQVCYCVPGQNMDYRLGISFLNILPSERAYIADYISINALIRNTAPNQQPKAVKE